MDSNTPRIEALSDPSRLGPAQRAHTIRRLSEETFNVALVEARDFAY